MLKKILAFVASLLTFCAVAVGIVALIYLIIWLLSKTSLSRFIARVLFGSPDTINPWFANIFAVVLGHEASEKVSEKICGDNDPAKTVEILAALTFLVFTVINIVHLIQGTGTVNSLIASALVVILSFYCFARED